MRLAKDRYSDLPPGFDLKNYEVFKELSSTQWFEQICARKNISDILPKVKNDNDRKFFARYVEFSPDKNSNPIIYTNIDDDTRWNIGDDLIDRFMNSHVAIAYARSVHQMTPRESFYSMRSLGEEKIDYLSKYLRQFDDDYDKYHYLSNWVSWDKWIDKPLDQVKHTYEQFASLMVNLDLPDKMLIEGFKAELKRIRSKQVRRKKNIRSFTFNSDYLIDRGVIPYIDISIWAQINQKKMPTNKVIANHIYIPDPNGGNDGERVRKTTTKLVKQVLSEEFLTGLASVAAQEHSV